MKRLTDIILALLLFVPAVLVCIPALVMIWLENRGNPLFCQKRVGKDKRPFTLFKLRTMAIDTEDRASHEVSAAQITRTGNFLRRTKLDELPQVINVLAGNMSFVGPRPCLPSQSELITERDKRSVFSIRPGITGPAQLAGVDMSTPEILARADAAYLTSQSFWGDIRLIAQTATGGGRGDAVG